MKSFTVNSKDFSSLLTKMSTITKRKTTIPILDKCLIFINEVNSTIEARATNLEVDLISSIPIALSQGGDYNILIDPSEINKIVKKMAEQPLTVYVAENDIEIRSDKSSYKFPYLIDDAFPKQLDNDNKPVDEFTFEADAFIEMIDKLSHMVGKDELRPIMNGINLKQLEISNDAFAAATDAHMLCKLNVGSLSNNDFNLVIPNIKDIVKILTLDESLTMKIYDKKFSIEAPGHDKLIVRCIEGTYPNYDSVIPDISDSINVTLDVNELTNAISRISFINNYTIILDFDFENNKLFISNENLDNNTQGTETIRIIDVSNKGKEEDFKIGLSPVKLATLLDSFTFSEVNMFLSEPMRAVIFKPANVNTDVELYLLMPMQIGG